jgi:hypothetical protein
VHQGLSGCSGPISDGLGIGASLETGDRQEAHTSLEAGRGTLATHGVVLLPSMEEIAYVRGPWLRLQCGLMRTIVNVYMLCGDRQL